MSGVTLFVQTLVKQAPGLAPILTEHLEANGELLSHVFMGDVTRYLLAQASKREPAADQEVAALLGIMESSLVEGDEEVRNVIVASFLDNLWDQGQPAARIDAMLGPRLRREREAME